MSPRSLNPGKALAMAICPIIHSFYDFKRTLMHDVACEFACAVRMRRNNKRERLNLDSYLGYTAGLIWEISLT